GKEQKEEIDKAKKALNEALKGKDIEEIKKKMDELSKAVQKVGATIYQQAQAAQAQGAEEKKEQKEEKEKKEEGEVVDAEYKVEEEEKK
ncbi:MAG: molecular chaperone DnaK, partial [Candidatus Altiarchaeales archaeon]